MGISVTGAGGVRWQLGIAGALLVLLGVLATLQYRWLGDVAEAERERIRAGLRSRASEFAQEFDSELTKVYVAFHVDGERLDLDPAAAIDDAMTRWQSTIQGTGMVQAIYLGEQKDGVVSWRRFHAHALEPSDWPPRLDTWRRASEHLSRIVGHPAPLIPGDVLDPEAPAIIIGIPKLKRIESSADMAYVPDPSGIQHFLAIELESEWLQHQLLEPLVAKYFGSASGGDYMVTIVRRDDPASTVYTTTGDAVVDATTADVIAPLFDLRLDEVRRLMMIKPPPRIGSGDPPEQIAGPARGRFAIATFVRRADGREDRGVMLAGGPGEGAWQIRVRHRSGSLESIVARSRRRNLAISLGILGLLAAAVALVILSAQRQQRLARQQMEFVAAVSHELRTPLAVICSAGENLADGVVADRSQVKRYGALVESEGRRLTDMVDRVMEFAGIGTKALLRSRTDVNISAVIAEAVNGISAEARDRGVSVSLRSEVTPSETLVVSGDPDALRSAVQNIVGNAIKYSSGGGHVDVGVEAAGPLMTIRVSDRGLGIDSADLPHVFEPFYRGRRALDAQIRGTGVGLTIVRRVIDDHEGAIRIESRAGEGTTVTVELPLTLARTAA